MNEDRPAAVYSGLQFSFQDMIAEIRGLRQLAASFLDRGTGERGLQEWEGRLSTFSRSGEGATLRWAIPEDRPIRTTISNGAYQPDERGEYSVVGTLSAVWDITHVGKFRTHNGRMEKVFSLHGNGSTRMQILDVGHADKPPLTIAEWTVDVGTEDSPGCHFHKHVHGATEDCHFPAGLDVPRFPSILVTPMDSLEFLLSELFQEQWTKHVAKHANTTGWKDIQKRRLLKYLEWHRHLVQNANFTPWISLKCTKPDSAILVRED